VERFVLLATTVKNAKKQSTSMYMAVRQADNFLSDKNDLLTVSRQLRFD